MYKTGTRYLKIPVKQGLEMRIQKVPKWSAGVLKMRDVIYWNLPFDVDVAHLVAGEECVVLENNFVRVPDDHPQLVRRRLPRRDVNLESHLEQRFTIRLFCQFRFEKNNQTQTVRKAANNTFEQKAARKMLMKLTLGFPFRSTFCDDCSEKLACLLLFCKSIQDNLATRQQKNLY